MRIACKENPSEPEIVSYVNGDLVVELDSVLVCKNNQEPPPKEGEKKEGDETPGEPADAPIKHVGSGLGFFFLMCVLSSLFEMCFGSIDCALSLWMCRHEWVVWIGCSSHFVRTSCSARITTTPRTAHAGWT